METPKSRTPVPIIVVAYGLFASWAISCILSVGVLYWYWDRFTEYLIDGTLWDFVIWLMYSPGSGALMAVIAFVGLVAGTYVATGHAPGQALKIGVMVGLVVVAVRIVSLLVTLRPGGRVSLFGIVLLIWAVPAAAAGGYLRQRRAVALKRKLDELDPWKRGESG